MAPKIRTGSEARADMFAEARRHGGDFDRRPGMTRNNDELVGKVGTWIGLAIVIWVVMFALIIATVKTVRWLF